MYKKAFIKFIMVIICIALLPVITVVYSRWSGPSVYFSLPGGFYDKPFFLEIKKAPYIKNIYYTLDGSEPTPGAEGTFNYAQPILMENVSSNPNKWANRDDIADFFEDIPPSYNVDKGNIIRAVGYDSEGRRCEDIAATYFVELDMDKYGNITVLSFIADPDDIFGYENGIYVIGKSAEVQYEPDFKPRTYTLYERKYYEIPSNFLMRGREWERECNVEFFFPGKEKDFSQKLGIRIKGGVGRHYAQKGFALYARSEYGKDILNHDFWNGASTGDIKESSIALSSGGFCDKPLKLKDPMAYDLSRDRAISAPAWRPTLLFLNGEYWGYYQLRQKIDEEYLEYRYGISRDNIAIIQVERDAEDQDNWHLYDKLLDFVRHNDMTDDNTYMEFCEIIDIESLMDYYGINIYLNNTDWPDKNVVLWRSIEKGPAPMEDCKWRWVLSDLNIDNCMNAYMVDENVFEYALDRDIIFSELFKNDNFRNDFLDNLEEMSRTTFKFEDVHERLFSYGEELGRYIEEDYLRFPNYNTEDETFIDNMENMDFFFRERSKIITDQIKAYSSSE